jgi:hypothetical protein
VADADAADADADAGADAGEGISSGLETVGTDIEAESGGADPISDIIGGILQIGGLIGTAATLASKPKPPPVQNIKIEQQTPSQSSEV